MTGSVHSPALWFAVAVLGVYRLAHLIAAEDGPFDVIARLRRAAGHGQLGKLLDCPYCLSLWVALPFSLALGADTGERALLWLGLSGGSVFLERLTRGRPESTTIAPYVEGATPPARDDQLRVDDGVLRK